MGGVGEFFVRELMELVGGEADVGSICGTDGGGLAETGNFPLRPAVGDGGGEGIVVEVPVAPGAVAGEFGAGINKDDPGGIGEFDEAEGEADGGEPGSGEGDVVGGAATRMCHERAPTRPSRWA